MDEFARYISPEVFESGLVRRLLVGEVVVGQICKIRIEYDTVQRQVRYAEATISIVKKRSTEEGEAIGYIYEASRVSGKPFGDTDTFNADSVAVSPETNFRSYLTDELDPRWDEGLKGLVDIEANDSIQR